MPHVQQSNLLQVHASVLILRGGSSPISQPLVCALYPAFLCCPEGSPLLAALGWLLSFCIAVIGTGMGSGNSAKYQGMNNRNIPPTSPHFCGDQSPSVWPPDPITTPSPDCDSTFSSFFLIIFWFVLQVRQSLFNFFLWQVQCWASGRQPEIHTSQFIMSQKSLECGILLSI